MAVLVTQTHGVAIGLHIIDSLKEYIHCIVHTVYVKVHNENFTVNSTYLAVYYVHCTVYYVHCTVYFAHFTVYYVHFTESMYIVHGSYLRPVPLCRPVRHNDEFKLYSTIITL